MSQLESSPQSSRVMPVQASERIEFVDILRGFALLGVLLMNMYSLSGQDSAYALRSALGAMDRAIVILTRFLVEAKFYSLFSFLFGWGMAVQMARAGAKGARFGPLFLRRLFVLLTIGVLHVVVIWCGDILITYALFGFLLLLFYKRSPRIVLLAAGLALLLSIVLPAPGEAMDAFRGWYADVTDFLRSDRYPERLYATGTYLEIARLRVQDFLAHSANAIYYFGNVFGMFLLGLYVGKRGILRRLSHHLSTVRRVMWIGLGVGLIFNGIFVSTVIWPERWPSEYHYWVHKSSRTVGAPALMLFYVCCIILLVQKETWHRRLAPLADLGRGALSNYLFQSLVCTLIFNNYGLGLYGEIGPTFGLVLTVVIYWAQIQISAWWFERFQFGPMEWLWRTLTYGARQPLRRGQTYDDVTWPRWVHRVRRLAARVDLRIVLVGLSAVLVMSVAGLVGWYIHSVGGVPGVAFEVPILSRATATPVVTRTGTQSQAQAEVFATPQVRPVPFNPGPIAASGDLLALASTFSSQSAMTHIETLTGPPYLGRYTGSPEGWAAGEYIAQQFATYGLQPAGDDGTFFQAFPAVYEYNPLARVPSLVVERSDGTAYDRYVLYEDFSPITRWYAGSGMASGEVVWANDCTRDDFASLEVVGKIALCRSGSIQEAGRYALEHGVTGLLLLTDPQQRPPDFGNRYSESWVPESIPTFRVFPSVAQDLLLGSGKSVDDLSITFEPFPLLTGARMEIETAGSDACATDGCLGRNVLGVIPGRDPDYADQVVILGAHYDHMGQAPDGTVWAGANDNASGVAVMLDIARLWHEQGYVPRRTVLFAAWDAEEMGLWGSTHYVQHPRYPLQNTVAKIQLDMVGAGGGTLLIDGGGDLGDQLQAVAQALDVESERTDSGRSDHVPFQMAGIPASLLIWQFEGEEEAEPQYHRPSDTPAIIDLEKLEAVGKIAGITLLAFTEGEPAIGDFLARRAAAVERGDVGAFLATSLPEQWAADRDWFADAQALSVTRCEMRASDVRVMGQTATADVNVTLNYSVGGEIQTKTAALPVRFVHENGGWRWAGPDLVWLDQETGFAVAHPPGKGEGLEGLGALAAEQYAEIAASLGLPPRPDASLLLFPSSKALRASIALSSPSDQMVWVGPGTVKLVYRREISASQQLTDTLALLALADAGVTEAAASWLWQGLPLALTARTAEIETQSKYLPELQKTLAEGTFARSEAASWAAVDYLQQHIGWRGVGQLIATLGQACRDGLCGSTTGLDSALFEALDMDSVAFEAAWQSHWRERLTAAQSNVDAVLTTRAAAVLAGDEIAFLNTVDPDVPNLLAEEGHWFADVADGAPASFSLAGEPVALLEDGSVLAAVALRYQWPESAKETTVSLEARFTPHDGGYRWAGVSFETLWHGGATMLYPAGQEALALALLEEAAKAYDQMAAQLNVERPDALTIKLYPSDDEFRRSVFLTPVDGWISAWTGAGGSVKLRWQKGATLGDYRSALTVQLARRLLHQIGVDSEWLMRGVSIHLSGDFDDGVTQQAAASNLYKVLLAVSKNPSFDLGAISPECGLPQSESGMADAWAWDAVRYLVYTHGWEALVALLHAQGDGLDCDAALPGAIGQTMSQFEAAWLESVGRGHALPEWIEVAQAFDAEMANRHVAYLASPELAGRRAGSPGAEMAAGYIAEKFAEYGLMPVGDPVPGGTVGQASFLQRFPITLTTLLSAPRFEILDQEGRILETFGWYEDFTTLLSQTGSGGIALGELVWIQDGDYQGMDLDGKIALRPFSNAVEIEIARAAEHGAGGLLLVGNAPQRATKDLLPLALPSNPAIPVLQLTQGTYQQLLEVSGHTQADIVNAPPALPLGLTARIEILVSTPEAVETVNVLGLLPGSDPLLKHKVILLGAHYDHVGDDPEALLCPVGTSVASEQGVSNCERVAGRRYDGANDDASGVAVLLEIARLWQETGYRPQHSVLFAAWGAQELGQVGSRYYVEHPAWPLEKVVAMLQLDAVGGGRGYYLEAQGARERDGLLLFSVMGAEDWVDGRLAIRGQVGESDHIPFREAGLPTLLLAWREASEDNRPVELADAVEPYRLGVTGRIVTLALMSLAR